MEDLARGLGRAVRDGWTDGESPAWILSIHPTCGTVNDADDVFCKGCGQRLTGRVCPSCRASNDADARFCDRCGATLYRRRLNFRESLLSMRNIKLLLSYDGTDFSGWQRQADRRTVQQDLETAIGRLTGSESRTNASGRTDAGVHA